MTRKSRMSRIGALVVLFVALAVASTAITGAFAHTDKTAAPVARSGDRAVQLVHRKQVANRDGESVQRPHARCSRTGQVDCSVYNSGTTSAADQQISNLISQHVDAIVINAASPTGLNGIIGRRALAHPRVSYDNVVTAPCAAKVNTGSTSSSGSSSRRSSSTVWAARAT